MSFTYLQLKDAVKAYTEYEETSFVNNIPLFIRLSEERILKNVQLSLFRKNATAKTSASVQYIKVPSDFLAPFSLSMTGSDGDKFFVEFKDPSFVQSYTPDSTTTGLPKYYCQFDVDNFLMGPTPNAVFTAELHYYYRPISLTAGADSEVSWLSENAEMTLLYGALIEAYTYMKGETDVIQNYNNMYMQSMERLKDLGEARENTDANRVGLPARPRT